MVCAGAHQKLLKEYLRKITNTPPWRCILAIFVLRTLQCGMLVPVLETYLLALAFGIVLGIDPF